MPKGTIKILQEKCKGCRLCLEACRHGNITPANGMINAQGYTPMVFSDPEGKCTGCKMCAEICPDCCIAVFRAIKNGGEKESS